MRHDSTHTHLHLHLHLHRPCPYDQLLQAVAELLLYPCPNKEYVYNLVSGNIITQCQNKAVILLHFS